MAVDGRFQEGEVDCRPGGGCCCTSTGDGSRIEMGGGGGVEVETISKY